MDSGFSRELTWRLTVPLATSGELTLTRVTESVPPRLTMAVIERLQDAVVDRQQLTRQDLKPTKPQPTFSYRGAA